MELLSDIPVADISPSTSAGISRNQSDVGFEVQAVEGTEFVKSSFCNSPLGTTATAPAASAASPPQQQETVPRKRSTVTIAAPEDEAALLIAPAKTNTPSTPPSRSEQKHLSPKGKPAAATTTGSTKRKLASPTVPRAAKKTTVPSLPGGKVRKSSLSSSATATPSASPRKISIVASEADSVSGSSADEKASTSSKSQPQLLGASPPASRRATVLRRPSAAPAQGLKRTGTSSNLLQRSASGIGGGANRVMQARVDARQRVERAAIRLQRWWRLLMSQRHYSSQLARLKRTQAARAIQYTWLRYTWSVYSSRLIGDFGRWAALYRCRLLSTMRRIVRRELLRRRFAAIIIIRSLRWRVLRPVRALQIKRHRRAVVIQEWWRELWARINSRKRFGIRDAIMDNARAELHERQILEAEQGLDWISVRVLESEHMQLSRAGDHLEAWRLFLRRGGYDERIARTQQRLTAAEDVARRDLLADEDATRENITSDRRFFRQKLEAAEKQARSILSPARRLGNMTAPAAHVGSCCGVNAAASPLRNQLSRCGRTAFVPTPPRRPGVPPPLAAAVSQESQVLPLTNERACVVGFGILRPGSAAAAAAIRHAGIAADQIARLDSAGGQRLYRHTVYTSISALL